MKKLIIGLSAVAAASAGGYFVYQQASSEVREQAKIAVTNAFKQASMHDRIEGAFFKEIKTGNGYITVVNPHVILDDGITKIDIKSQGDVRIDYNVKGDSLTFKTSDTIDISVKKGAEVIQSAVLTPEDLELKTSFISSLYALEAGTIEEILDRVDLSIGKMTVENDKQTIEYKVAPSYLLVKENHIVADVRDITTEVEGSIFDKVEDEDARELLKQFESLNRIKDLSVYVDVQDLGDEKLQVNKFNVATPAMSVKGDAFFDVVNKKELKLNMMLTPEAKYKEHVAQQLQMVTSTLDLIFKEDNADKISEFLEKGAKDKIIISAKDVKFLANTLKTFIVKTQDKAEEQEVSSISVNVDVQEKSGKPMVNLLRIAGKEAALEMKQTSAKAMEIKLNNYKLITEHVVEALNNFLLILPAAGENLNPEVKFDLELPEMFKTGVNGSLQAMATSSTMKTDNLVIELRQGARGVTIGTQPAQAYAPQVMMLGLGAAQALKQQLPPEFITRFDVGMKMVPEGTYGEPDFRMKKEYRFKVLDAK